MIARAAKPPSPSRKPDPDVKKTGNPENSRKSQKNSKLRRSEKRPPETSQKRWHVKTETGNPQRRGSVRTAEEFREVTQNRLARERRSPRRWQEHEHDPDTSPNTGKASLEEPHKVSRSRLFNPQIDVRP
jgi:hypothetical protein